MQENIELAKKDKVKLKVVSAAQSQHMKDLLIKEAHTIIDTNADVPLVERSTDRTSLIIKIDDSLKEEILTFCEVHQIRIRDFWVECTNRIIKRYKDEKNTKNI